MASKPNPIDVHVGRRLRLRRTLLGMSQERLGELLGLTFQQVQKYERGVNRIGSSRLWELGRVLKVPVSFFFDDMQDGVHPAAAGLGAPGLADAATPFEHAPQAGLSDDDAFQRRETLELVRAYYRIDDPVLRKRLFELAKALADYCEETARPGAGHNDSSTSGDAAADPWP